MRDAILRLLKPKSIAIVGASPTPGSLGGSVLANLERFGFAGNVHLVNPNRSEIGGRSCVPSVDALPRDIDCAILAIPRSGALAAIVACGERGVGGAVVFSAGFAEVGDEGRALQIELAQAARAAGMALAGPNCLGLINFVDSVPLTFSVAQPHAITAPGLAVVSQSGAMATVLRSALLARELPISFAISTGNEAVCGVEDFLDVVIDDPMTRSVAMVVEQFGDPQRFLGLARRARAIGKSILLLHPGRSAAARASAATHTGKLAGDHALMRCQVQAEGVILVDTLEELIDCSEILARCPTRPAGGCAVMTDSGVFKAMTLDLCEETGLALPVLQQETLARLREVMPAFAPLDNPLDMTAQALVQPELYGFAMRPLLDDPNIGSLVLTLILSSKQMNAQKIPQAVATISDIAPTKPVIVAMLGDDINVPEDVVGELRRLGVPFSRSPERTLRALARVSRSAAPVSRVEAVPIVISGLKSGAMAEHISKQVLEGCGLSFPERELALTVDAALDAAARIGYPVALKAQSDALLHKTEVGGVVLRITDAKALRASWQKLHENLDRHAPGLQLDGVLVEAMASPGIELILGARRDPQWGPVLLAGFGGIMAEALQDVRLMQADLSEEAIAAEILKLKGATVLTGFRGGPPADIPAVARLLGRLGAVMRNAERIAEIDLNPVMLYPRGQGALALDALIVCG